MARDDNYSKTEDLPVLRMFHWKHFGPDPVHNTAENLHPPYISL